MVLEELIKGDIQRCGRLRCVLEKIWKASTHNNETCRCCLDMNVVIMVVVVEGEGEVGTNLKQKTTIRMLSAATKTEEIGSFLL
jgi:hypothetical protein